VYTGIDGDEGCVSVLRRWTNVEERRVRGGYIVDCECACERALQHAMAYEDKLGIINVSGSE
jgi:hypothetical protein